MTETWQGYEGIAGDGDDVVLLPRADRSEVSAEVNLTITT